MKPRKFLWLWEKPIYFLEDAAGVVALFFMVAVILSL